MSREQKPKIQVYELGQDQFFLTDGETCWDMTPTLGWRSLPIFMLELASAKQPDWPMHSRSWDEFRNAPETRDLVLVAQMDNPGEKTEKISILTDVMQGGARNAFAIIDFNPNTWEYYVRAQLELDDQTDPRQPAQNMTKS